MAAKDDGKTPSGIPLPPVNVPRAGLPVAPPLESVTEGGNPTWIRTLRPDDHPTPVKR